MRLTDKPLSSDALNQFITTLKSELGRNGISLGIQATFENRIVEPLRTMARTLETRPEIGHIPTITHSGTFCWNVRDVLFKQKYDSYPQVKLLDLRQQLSSLCNDCDASEQKALKGISEKAINSANRAMESHSR